MATGPKAGLYWNAQSVSYLQWTLIHSIKSYKANEEWNWFKSMSSIVEAYTSFYSNDFISLLDFILKSDFFFQSWNRTTPFINLMPEIRKKNIEGTNSFYIYVFKWNSKNTLFRHKFQGVTEYSETRSFASRAISKEFMS